MRLYFIFQFDLLIIKLFKYTQLIIIKNKSLCISSIFSNIIFSIYYTKLGSSMLKNELLSCKA